MKILKRIATALALASACVALSGNQVGADDGKNYPGSVCVKLNGSGGNAIYNWSGIGNDAVGSALSVDCPAMKDGGGTVSAFARVLDKSSGNISCTLVDVYVVAGESGATFHADTDTDSTSGTSNNWQDLTFPAQTTGSASYKFMACSIPANNLTGPSYVQSFNIVES